VERYVVVRMMMSFVLFFGTCILFARTVMTGYEKLIEPADKLIYPR
jgi:hypothetical protein